MPISKSVRRRSVLTMALGALLAEAATSSALAEPRPVTIYAPFALAGALDIIAEQYRKVRGVPIHVVYGPGSALNEFLRHNLGGEILFTADSKWMNLALNEQLVIAGSKVDLLTCRLVLVRRRTSAGRELDLGDGMQLSDYLNVNGKLVMCDPQRAAEGRVGLASLKAMGLWAATEPRTEFTGTGKDAIELVANDSESLGVVFDTDAAQEPGIEVAGIFPDGSHSPIVFSFALTAGASQEAVSLSAFLRGSEAMTTFQQFGFQMVGHRHKPLLVP